MVYHMCQNQCFYCCLLWPLFALPSPTSNPRCSFSTPDMQQKGTPALSLCHTPSQRYNPPLHPRSRRRPQLPLFSKTLFPKNHRPPSTLPSRRILLMRCQVFRVGFWMAAYQHSSPKRTHLWSTSWNVWMFNRGKLQRKRAPRSTTTRRYTSRTGVARFTANGCQLKKSQTLF